MRANSAEIVCAVDIAEALLLHHRHYRRAVALAREDAQQVLVEELSYCWAQRYRAVCRWPENQLVRQHARSACPA
ncbi:hypothetical protein ACVXG7_07350 [Enterobacter hormaechei]